VQPLSDVHSNDDWRSPAADYLLGQVEQPGIRRAKAAGVFVEGRQGWFVIHVQPLAAGSPRLLDKRLNQCAADALPLIARVDGCVQYEGVGPAVPAGVREPNQGRAVEGAHPGEAVVLQPVLPRLRSAARPAERAGLQVRQRLIIDGEAETQFQS